MGLVDALRALAAKLGEHPDVFAVELAIGPPATAEAIAAAERNLGRALPPDLVALYRGESGRVSFAWSVRNGQEHRLRAEEGAAPTAQLELWAPGELSRWSGGDHVVVFGDGTGNGVALDLAPRARRPWVTFDHDEDAGGAPFFDDVAAVIATLGARAFTADADEELVTPTLRRFLAGKGALAKAKRVVAAKAPRAASKAAKAVPSALALAPHKSRVSAIVALSDGRIVTAAAEDKNLLVRDPRAAKPLGKLPCARHVGVLLEDGAGRLVATGRGELARYDLGTGTRSVLHPYDPYTTWAAFAPDGAYVALTTAFVEIFGGGPASEPPRRIATWGSSFLFLDAARILVFGSTKTWKLSLITVDLAAGAVAAQTDWAIPGPSFPAATLVDGVLHLALDDGTLVRVPPPFADPGLAPPSRFAGPAVRLADGRTWLVARQATRPLIDVFDLARGERRATWEAEGVTETITTLAVARDRVVIGGLDGAVVSVDAAVFG